MVKDNHFLGLTKVPNFGENFLSLKNLTQDTKWNLRFCSQSLLLPVITKQLKTQLKEVIVKLSVNIYINFLVIIYLLDRSFTSDIHTCIYVYVYIYKNQYGYIIHCGTF